MQCLFEDLKQFDLEDKGGAGRNGADGLLAIAEVVGDVEDVLGAFVHKLQAFGPARDDGVQRELGGFAAVDAAVELGAVDEGAGIVDADTVGGFGFLAIAFLDNLVLEAALGGVDGLVEGVLLEEFLTFVDVFVLAGHHFVLFGTLAFLEFLLEAVEEGTHHLVGPGVLSFVAVDHGLAGGLAVDAEVLLEPALVDVLADGVGSGVVKVFEHDGAVHVVHALLFLVGCESLVEGFLCVFVGVGLLFEQVVVGFGHGDLAALNGYVLSHDAGAEDEKNCDEDCFFHFGYELICFLFERTIFIANSRHKKRIAATICLKRFAIGLKDNYLYSLGVAPSRISLPQMARASISFSPLYILTGAIQSMRSVICCIQGLL